MTGQEAYELLTEASIKGGAYVTRDGNNAATGILHDPKGYRSKGNVAGAVVGAAAGAARGAIRSKQQTKRAVEDYKKEHRLMTKAEREVLEEYEKDANKRAVKHAVCGALVGGYLGSKAGASAVDLAAAATIHKRGGDPSNLGYIKYKDAIEKAGVDIRRTKS